MGIFIPSITNYCETAANIISIANKTPRVEAIVYGSLIGNRAKPGLSDIDALIYHESENFIFPPEIQACFDTVQTRANELRIPIQITWATSQSFSKTGIFSEDIGFILEVQRGLKSSYKTQGIEEVIEGVGIEGVTHDIAMLRFFQRKIQRLGEKLTELGRVLQKEESSITKEEQAFIREVWDILKKINHICSLYIRILGKEPTFGIKDFETIEGYDSRRLCGLFGQINDIEDWFLYLKNNGITELSHLIHYDFEIICRFIDKEIGQN